MNGYIIYVSSLNPIKSPLACELDSETLDNDLTRPLDRPLLAQG